MSGPTGVTLYLISYGYKAPELPIIVTTLTVAALGEIAPFELPAIQEGGKEPLDEALIARRAVFLDRKLTKDVRFFDRAKLLAGNIIAGPAVVVEAFATTVIPAGSVLRVDGKGRFRITP